METQGGMPPCPSSPNCVSSDAKDKSHHISPYRLAAEPAEAWETLQEIVRSLPRATIRKSDSESLHAEVHSRIFRFVDDVEFHLRPDQKIIAVRSASRVGYSDLGVNRRRVEKIRKVLRFRGVVE